MSGAPDTSRAARSSVRSGSGCAARSSRRALYCCGVSSYRANSSSSTAQPVVGPPQAQERLLLRESNGAGVLPGRVGVHGAMIVVRTIVVQTSVCHSDRKPSSTWAMRTIVIGCVQSVSDENRRHEHDVIKKPDWWLHGRTLLHRRSRANKCEYPRRGSRFRGSDAQREPPRARTKNREVAAGRNSACDRAMLLAIHIAYSAAPRAANQRTVTPFDRDLPKILRYRVARSLV